MHALAETDRCEPGETGRKLARGKKRRNNMCCLSQTAKHSVEGGTQFRPLIATTTKAP